jgi:hypothetical protein
LLPLEHELFVLMLAFQPFVSATLARVERINCGELKGER